MKKELKQSLKIVTVALLLSVGISYVSSYNFWNNAGGVAPAGNVSEVINTSANEQTKEGTLFVENGGSGKISADALKVFGLTYLGAKLDIGKKFVGGIGGFGIPASTLNTNLSITGKLGVNLDGLDPTAGVHADGTMRLRPLAASFYDGISYPATICADELGTLMLCDAPFGFSWNVGYIAQGGNLECYSDKKTITVVPTAGTEPYTATWTFSSPGAEDDIIVEGSGLSRTVTFWKNENTAYTTTVTVTLDDSSPTVDPITSNYTQSVPMQPESLGGGAACPE